jgi:hypothetical protein
MGFRFPARIEYDIDNLGDEVAEKALLIQLADRNLISDELLQYRFGSDPEMEKTRLTRENRERDNGTFVPKSGPWHDPQVGVSYKKIGLQKGVLSPGQVGLTEKAKRREMRILLDEKNDVVDDKDGSLKTPKQNTNLTPGRPKNSKDKEKRKSRTFKPQVRAKLDIWLTNAHKQITDIINTIYLQYKNKKNMRCLTAQEMNEIESVRRNVLFNLQPFEQITKKMICDKLIMPSNIVFEHEYKRCINNISTKLTLSERQKIQSQIYITCLGNGE